MLSNGYFFGGSGSGANIGSNNGENDVFEKDGNIIFAPTDPIYIDEDNKVFFSNENKNARMYFENENVYVERLF